MPVALGRLQQRARVAAGCTAGNCGAGEGGGRRREAWGHEPNSAGRSTGRHGGLRPSGRMIASTKLLAGRNFQGFRVSGFFRDCGGCRPGLNAPPLQRCDGAVIAGLVLPKREEFLCGGGWHAQASQVMCMVFVGAEAAAHFFSFLQQTGLGGLAMSAQRAVSSAARPDSQGAAWG